MDWVPTGSVPGIEAEEQSPLLTDPALAYSYIEGICRGYENAMRECIERMRELADTVEAELADSVRLVG